MNVSAAEKRIRTALLVLAALMFAGTPVELWLADHTGETAQFIPFLLCALGLIAVIAMLMRRSHRSLVFLRGVMLLNIAGGLLGMALHLGGNFSFEREIRPNAEVTSLVLDTLKGVNPLLAPGLLVFIALVALIATYHYEP